MPTEKMPTEKKSTSATPKMKTASKAMSIAEVTSDMIARRAFEIWCGKGQPWGGETENWRQAQEELTYELGFSSSSRVLGSRADARS